MISFAPDGTEKLIFVHLINNVRALFLLEIRNKIRVSWGGGGKKKGQRL